MTVALYCRVSTDEQAQQGFSIGNQQERLISFSTSQGWDDYRLYVDDGYTGTNMDRPALKRMISHIKSGHVKTVVVYRLDRLGRKQKDVLFMLEDVFDKHGVAFRSATEPFDTSTSLGKAMLGILAVFAQLERDTIIERVTSGRRSRIRKGLWYGGRVPFGYDWNSDTQQLTINPQQADLVRQIYRRSLEGQPYNAIAQWAAERTSDIVFDHGIVRDMLQRPIYMGRMNNIGDLVDGLHEAIIDEDMWHRVQAEVGRRKGGAPVAGQYLLSGLLRCGVCGGPMIHITNKSKGYNYDYYVCKKQHVRPKGSTHTCSLGFKRLEKIEATVVEDIKTLARMDNVTLIDVFQVAQEPCNPVEIADDLNLRIQEIDRQIDEFSEMVALGGSFKQFKERVIALQDERNKLELRLSEMHDTVSLKQDSAQLVINSVRLIGELWDDMSFDERQSILRAALNKIVVPTKGNLEYQWNV